ncbi:MAG: hypothetical protein AAGA77_24980 [Bacteroidota bacterium]
MKFTKSTCWILGAGASFDSLGQGRQGVPITRKLIDLRFVDESILKRLKRLINNNELPFETIEDALGRGLEITFKVIRELIERKDEKKSKRCRSDFN